MAVTVYQLPHSPYCLPITRVLGALGVAFEGVDISDADRSVIIRLTGGAYYQVPVLAHDGTMVYDGSGVAAEVTRRTAPANPTAPPPHVGGYDGLDVPRYVDRTWGRGRLFPAAQEVHPFLLGEQPVYADFALYGVLANLTYNDWNPFPSGLPRLADGFARMKTFRFL